VDIQILADVVIKIVKGVKKMELKQEQLKTVVGGATWLTSAMINAISKGINTLYELGRQTGSALRRIVKNKYCPIK